MEVAASFVADAPGHVPWWPEPYTNTNLFAILVHVLGETNRIAGHADILREGVDGRTGMRPEHKMQIDEDARTAYCAKIEQAARSAASVKAQKAVSRDLMFERHDVGREC
jgi:hypothetical protein